LPEREGGGSLTFILGGARSGKSAYAERLVMAHEGPWIYLATAEALDAEMTMRIALHRARRGDGWQTIEAPRGLVRALGQIAAGKPVLIDCLTLWLSNHMLADSDVETDLNALVEILSQPRGPWYVVSNEVGLGIVPDNALARRFRDAAGRLNARVAGAAQSVIFMVAGLPMTVK
jgi:adenosylcobinamide kinase/adenosylcobinamide-phosphate guanylyltransferase